MHRTTGEIQGGREAQPPGCTLHTLRSPSRRPQILPAGVRGFVARNRDTETGGGNERTRFERHDLHHGHTPRRRLHVHVIGNCTYARKPPDVTNLSHSGGLRAIVRGQGRLRAACEEGWGTMWDVIRATEVRTSRWGHDKDRGEGEIAEKIVGDHLVGWGAEAPTSIDNASMTGWTVPEPWTYPSPNPDQSAHPDPNPTQKGPLDRGKNRLRVEKTPICRGRGKPLADLPQGRPLGCRGLPLGSDEHGQCGVCLWTQYRKGEKLGKSGPKNNLGGDLFLETTSDPPHPQPKVNDNNNKGGNSDREGEGGGGKIAHLPPAGSHLAGSKNRYKKARTRFFFYRNGKFRSRTPQNN